MPPPSFDPNSLNDAAAFNSSKPSSSSPILILSPSSLSRRPQILEALLSSLPSSQPHDLQMLDRIALNFAKLPHSHYSEAIFALPPSEESPEEFENDYTELKSVFPKILSTMQPGGRVRIGSAKEEITKEAILAGFVIETQNQQV